MEHGPPSRLSAVPSHWRHRVLMVLLAATSGSLDALAFLAIGGVFASVMTGNLVLLGLSGGTRDGALSTHAVVALGGYVLGVVVGARGFRRRLPGGPTGGTPRLHALVRVELVLVAAFAVGWELVRSRSSSPAQLVLIALASVAMGLQSAAVRASTGNGLSTTYLTGTLTGVVVTALAGGGRLRDEWTGAAVLGGALAVGLGAGPVGAEEQPAE